jgi:hypothetical protein
MNEPNTADGGEQRFEIVFELPASKLRSSSYVREDGATVHGDASGEWTLDEDGDIEDIVFFVSPRWAGYGPKE